MARIRFVGDSPTCAWLGVKFQHGEWLAEHGLDSDQLARLRRHPHFEVEVPVASPAPTFAEASAGRKKG